MPAPRVNPFGGFIRLALRVPPDQGPHDIDPHSPPFKLRQPNPAAVEPMKPLQGPPKSLPALFLDTDEDLRNIRSWPHSKGSGRNVLRKLRLKATGPRSTIQMRLYFAGERRT